MRLALLLLPFPLAAQFPVPCEPGRETIQLLESVPPVRDTNIPYEQRVGAMRALAVKYPGDFFIQRAYQDSFRQWRHLGEEYDRALAMYRSRPDDPLSPYYEARLLMNAQPQRSRRTFDELLRAHPEFAWPHRDAEEWGRLPGRRDDPDAAAHAKSFAAACPEAFGTPNRAGLERRNTPLELVQWAELWRKENAPDRVAADLKRFESWRFRPSPELYFVHSEASRILKDPSILASLRARVEREAPGSSLALQFAQEDWQRDNPPLDRNASPAERRARQAKEIAAAREQGRRWPNVTHLHSMALAGISGPASNGPVDISEADLEAIDRLLHAKALSPDFAHYPPVETAVARLCAAGRVRLDRVPALLDAGLRNIELMMKYDYAPELFPPEMRSNATDWRTITASQTEHIRADYLIAVGRFADARATVEQAVARLDPANPRQGFERQRWLRRLGEVEAHDGGVEKALGAYQASLAGYPRQALDSPDMQVSLAPVKRYYLEHGGSEEQWIDWATAGVKPLTLAPTPPEFTTPLPDFSAKDLAGGARRLADLKGRATLVNFWATWCGPCRGEHPAIQEFYEKTKDRRDVQVLTISVDEDTAAVQPYLKEKSYTFPVIHDPALADKLFPWAGLPTNFLVDPRGMRSGMRGVPADSASVTRLIEELAKIAAK